MKKLLAIILSLMLSAFLLVSCGGSASSASKDGDGEELTIASCGGGGYIGELQFVIEEFEEKYGWTINIIDYDIEKDYYALQAKLLAKDSDIDLIYSPTLDMYNLIQTQYYVDLSQYEGLRSRIESNSFTKYACSYNNEYFGLSIFPMISVDYEVTSSLTSYKYMFYNVNLLKKTYSDPDGDELFNVLKHYYQYPYDPIDTPYYDTECDYIMSEYLVISPYSSGKDNAAKFLEKVFDYINGDVEYTDDAGNIQSANSPYPDVETFENVYLFWMHGDGDNITKPIGEAINEAIKSDGSDEVLRQLAQEAARQVRMRLEG